MVVPQNSSAYFRTLALIHLALASCQLLFAGISLYLVCSRAIVTSDELRVTFRWIVPAVLAAGFLGSQAIFGMMVRKAAAADQLTGKMNGYRTALILRYALLEGPALLALVLFMMSGEFLFLAGAALLIGWFLFQRPSKRKAIAALHLDYEDTIKLDSPEEPVSELRRRGF